MLALAERLSVRPGALVLFVQEVKEMAGFAGDLSSNLAREVGRLTGWTGKVWERRHQANPISGEEEAAAVRDQSAGAELAPA